MIFLDLAPLPEEIVELEKASASAVGVIIGIGVILAAAVIIINIKNRK